MCEGDTAKLNPGVWTIVAYISAMTFVTAIADGKYPKYFGDCHNIVPGNITSSVDLITSYIFLPFSGGLSDSWLLKNPG